MLQRNSSEGIFIQSMDDIMDYDKLKFEHQEHQILLLVDLRCLNQSKNMAKITDYLQSGAPFRWIFISNTEIENLIPPENTIMRMNILPNTEALFIQRTDNRCYEISMVYKIGTETAWKTEKYAYWNMSGGFQKNTNINEVIAVRRRDLEGYEIKICYVLTDNDSIHHLSDEVNDHIDTITKVNFPSTNHLLDFLNAERKYVFVNTWGYRINGTWNGLTGFLVNGDVEIGGSPMFFTAERTAVVDFISSPTPTRSKFVFQQPKLSYENNLFLLSFRTAVWYSTLALISLIFTMLLAVTAWEWKKMSQIKTRDIDAGVLRPSVTDVTMLVFGATCQQGSTVELKGSLGRVVMLILFLTLMFLYTSYSANIVALLQSSSSQIKTLEDLLHSRLKFGVHDTVFNRYYFSTADEPVRKAIYEKKIAPPGVAPQFMSMEEGVKKMRKGLFAFHMETGVGYKFVGKYFKESEKCGLKEIQYLQVIDPWLAVRKNTPYKEMFKIGMKRIQEHGLQNRENRLLYEKRPKCSGRESNFVSVSMVDCYPALLVLSYGIIIAIALVIMENLWQYRHLIKGKLEFFSSVNTIENFNQFEKHPSHNWKKFYVIDSAKIKKINPSTN
uniref:Ionotropic glutamate receptor C-terminal domain-containing protein n=1 Tax=Bombyx mori TaxID=7091 RepID=A0A8R2DLY3_BOMMO|nr:ionotropic receptor 75a [Bombyx mori]